MGTEKLREARDHLRVWLDRSEEVVDAAPTVQQLHDQVDWAVRALERRPPEAGDVPLSPLDEYAEGVCQRVSELPMLPSGNWTALTAAASAATATAGSAVVGYVVNVSELQTPDAERYASAALSEYRQLQDAHQRPVQVRMLLKETLPAAAQRFDSARDAYRRWKSGHATERAAALEMRTFLDGLKGALLDRARRHPKENMTLDIMVERLFSSAPTQTEVERQFEQRSSLIEALSAIAKRQGSSASYDIDALWARVLDHAFIVVNALNGA